MLAAASGGAGDSAGTAQESGAAQEGSVALQCAGAASEVPLQEPEAVSAAPGAAAFDSTSSVGTTGAAPLTMGGTVAGDWALEAGGVGPRDRAPESSGRLLIDFLTTAGRVENEFATLFDEDSPPAGFVPFRGGPNLIGGSV